MDRKRRNIGWHGFIHQSRIRSPGPPGHDGRPVNGIGNSWSDLAWCESGLRQVAAGCRVREAGDAPALAHAGDAAALDVAGGAPGLGLGKGERRLAGPVLRVGMEPPPVTGEGN